MSLSKRIAKRMIASGRMKGDRRKIISSVGRAQRNLSRELRAREAQREEHKMFSMFNRLLNKDGEG